MEGKYFLTFHNKFLILYCLLIHSLRSKCKRAGPGKGFGGGGGGRGGTEEEGREHLQPKPA